MPRWAVDYVTDEVAIANGAARLPGARQRDAVRATLRATPGASPL